MNSYRFVAFFFFFLKGIGLASICAIIQCFLKFYQTINVVTVLRGNSGNAVIVLVCLVFFTTDVAALLSASLAVWKYAATSNWQLGFLQ